MNDYFWVSISGGNDLLPNFHKELLRINKTVYIRWLGILERGIVFNYSFILPSH